MPNTVKLTVAVSKTVEEMLSAFAESADVSVEKIMVEALELYIDPDNY